MSQTLGQVAFSQVQTTSLPKTLLLEALSSRDDATTFRLKLNGSAADGTRNVHSITIADPVGASVPDESFYVVTISDGTTLKRASFRFDTGMAQNDVAMELAAVVDLHPAVQAVASANVITVTAVVGGVPLTVSVECVDGVTPVAGAITTSEVTEETGTPGTMKPYAEVAVAVSASVDGKPKLLISGRWMNGSVANPAQAQPLGPYPATGPRSIADLEATA